MTTATAETATCPSCLTRLRYAAESAGRRARCRCGAVSLLPHPAGAMVFTPARRTAKPTPAAVAPWARIAAPFNVATKVPVEPKNPAMPRLRLRLMPGCLDGWVRGVAAGLVTTRLLARHDRTRELASSVGGNLALYADAEHLWVSLAHPRADLARLEVLLPALSPGYVPTKWTVGRDDRGPVVDVTECAVLEVSLVAEGLFPGTGLGLDMIRRPA